MNARFDLSRLASIRRHLTYANAMASIAVFVALGGGAYAAVHVNGKDIKNRTIAGKKVKNNTLRGKQINEKRLGQVPNAARAQSAAKADAAGTADTATSATTAGTAATATRAATADTAATATTATNADNANRFGGALPEVYFIDCPQGTTLYGGMCWDNTSRTATGWVVASDTCGDANGRLPTLSELVAYTTGPDTPLGVGNYHWSSDALDPGSVAVRDEGTIFNNAIVGVLPYRCLFYRSN